MISLFLQIAAMHVVVLGGGWVIGGDVVIWGLPALLGCALLAMGLQWVVFVPSALAKTERFYDLTGGVTYLSVVFFAAGSLSQHGALQTKHVILVLMVSIWALRLSLFLFSRVRRDGKDGRFDTLKTHPLRFLIAWSLQGVWVFFVASPVLIQLTDGAPTNIGIWTVLGGVMWCAGFVVEVIADRQKGKFNQDLKNRGRWIDQGLWRYSQHPNYFGEILLWTGLAVSGFAQYEGLQWCALVSPILTFLLLTRVSGIPMLDERALKKWGTEDAYLAYRRDTSVLVPWFRRPS